MVQLKKKVFIKGEIELLTGTHIGGTNSAMGIGGPDSTVIRNPIDNKPYIPGSSLKGKMRALVEIADGTISVKEYYDKKTNKTEKSYGVSPDPNSPSSKLFGSIQKDDKQRPSKLIVRDAKMISNEGAFANTDLPYTESKTEVVIDRITAKANPRQIERVPAGAKFELDLVLNVFEEDNMDAQMTTIFRALKLVQDDYLGGSGSRGYGQVKFDITSVIEKEMDKYFNDDYQGNNISEEWKRKIG